jgi:signal peptidase
MSTIADARHLRPTARHLRVTKRPRRVVRFALVASLLVALGGWWFTLAPRSLGGPATYVVVSGKSMLPLLHTGDLVIAHKQSQYHLGEIVVVSIDGGEVIHRLYAGNAKIGWKTKGINKLTPDLWTIPNKDVLGTKSFVVPNAGNWVRWAGTPTGRSALAAAIALFVVLIPRRNRRREKTVAPALSPRSVVLNSALLILAALGGLAGGLAGLDASVVGLRGWVTLPLTRLQVHPVLIALIAVVLLAISLPLIGLQVGREVLERRRLAALPEAGPAAPATGLLASDSPDNGAAAALLDAGAGTLEVENAVTVHRVSRRRAMHRGRVAASALS